MTINNLAVGEYYYKVVEQSKTDWTCAKMTYVVKVTVASNGSVTYSIDGTTATATCELAYLNTYVIPPTTNGTTNPTTETPTVTTEEETTTEEPTTTTENETTTEEPTTTTENETTAEPTITETESPKPETTTEPTTSGEIIIVTTEIPTVPTISEPTEPSVVPYEPERETTVRSVEPITPVMLDTPYGNLTYYDEIPSHAIPLVNGWFAVDIGENIYEIFDQNGVPLGFVVLGDGESIEDWKDYDNLTPFSVLIPEVQKPNPITGDNLVLLIAGAMLVFILLFALAARKKRKT